MQRGRLGLRKEWLPAMPRVVKTVAIVNNDENISRILKLKDIGGL